MGKLIYGFSHNQSKYVTVKHQYSEKNSNAKKNMIIKFLNFCETKQVSKISDIKQKHYDQFLQKLSESGLSGETLRKYSMVIKEFAVRAHLSIQANPTKAMQNKKIKKLNKIMSVILDHFDPDENTKQIITEQITQIL